MRDTRLLLLSFLMMVDVPLHDADLRRLIIFTSYYLTSQSDRNIDRWLKVGPMKMINRPIAPAQIWSSMYPNGDILDSQKNGRLDMMPNRYV